MRERVHGHIGIDLPVSGEQGAGRGVRPPKRRAPGPRPVRPYVSQAAVRRDGTPAVRRPADPAAVERDGGGGTAALGAGGVAGARPSEGGPGWVDGRGAVGQAGFAAWGSGAGRAGAVDGGVVGGSAVRTVGAAGGGAASLGAVGGAVGGAGRGCGSVAGRRPVRPSAGPRLLVSRPGIPAPRRGDRLRKLLAGLALVLVAAAVVVGLGRIADVAAQSRAAEAPAVGQVGQVGQIGQIGQVGQVGEVTVGRVDAGEVTVTVATAITVWEVADRVAPGASGPERAALVDRIVAANALASMRVAPGTVLRVPV